MKKQWQSIFHVKHGFDRTVTCKGKSAPSGAEDGEKSANTDRSLQEKEQKTSCCGLGLQRHIFNQERMECCEDGSSRPRGTC